MEDTVIFEGTIKVETDSGKIYLESNNRIHDLNSFLAKFIGEEVRIMVEKPESCEK